MLTTDTRVLATARLNSDSTDKFAYVATVSITGARGASVSLHLTAARGLLAGLPTDLSVRVSASTGEIASIALSDLEAGATVYRFTTDGQVVLRYDLPSRVGRIADEGQFQFTQHVDGGRAAGVDRPWMASTLALDPERKRARLEAAQV